MPERVAADHCSMEACSSPDKQLKVWQVWPGSHAFFCDGRLMVGPDIGVTVFAGLLTTAASAAFWVYVCPSLHASVAVGGVTLYVATVVFMYLTATSDPGILPRNTTMSDAEASVCASERRTVEINGMTVPLKWCRTCRIFRPPRAAHCSECNVCVERFDHHCPWMGQCIGRRNYRFFLGFIISVSLLCCYTLGFSALVGTRKATQALPSIRGDFFAKLMASAPATVGVTGFTGLILLCVAPLACYHCSLVCRNRTTSEEVKDAYRDDNPFDTTLCGNCSEACCVALPEPRLLPRSLVSEAGSHATLRLMPRELDSYDTRPLREGGLAEMEEGLRDEASQETSEDEEDEVDDDEEAAATHRAPAVAVATACHRAAPGVAHASATPVSNPAVGARSQPGVPTGAPFPALAPSPSPAVLSPAPESSSSPAPGLTRLSRSSV